MAFVDHHVHFLATAAARLSVDLTRTRCLADLIRALRAASVAGTAGSAGAAGQGEPAGWVRGWGYDEYQLAEGRHPTRWDLDRAGTGRPLVVHHRTGHAAVLDSRALAEIGEPDHPDGLFFDRHDLLSRVPRIDPVALAGAARLVSREWADAGIAAFVDATHTNGPAELELLAAWCREGVVGQAVTAMVAPAQATMFAGYGSGVGPVRVGHVKIMASAERLDLRRQVAAAHDAGYPVALHVMDIDVLDAALGALEASPPPEATSDRIEHNSISLPEQVGRLAATGASVVVNPSFLLHRRRKYERELSAVERGWLIRIRSLIDAGVAVRAGSDSPVTPARPAEIIAAATAHPFSPGESVDPATAAALLHP